MSRRYIEEILRARVYDVARESPLEKAARLSDRLGNNILLKREDEQQVFSFKLRGAYNKIYSLDDEARRRGVVAASAGNHAQGVALAGRELGVPATIVMPTTTPAIKVDTVRRLGGKAVLFGDSYDEANEHALSLAEETGLSFIHPFDDPKVIAGQGTIGMELLRQHADPIEAIFVPVGGGGLIAGVAAYVKHVRPDIRIIGVEPEDAPTLHAAMQAGRRVRLKQVGLFADGVAVRQIGKETFRVAKDLVDEVILVSTDQICAAIKDIYDDTRSVAEPAGALAVAGIKHYLSVHEMQGRDLVAILSGANINFDRLRHVAERTEIGEQREALLAVQIPERPGSFLRFCRLLGKRSITEFNYRYADQRQAQVFCGVELREGAHEKEHLIAHLQKKGYSVVDMTDNETAKLHIRYMVGGHAPQAVNERVYRFMFPERPGALLDFLSGLSRGWNISLFHYRNHGAAYGRVLVGIQLASAERKAFESYMQELGYSYTEETDNPAYRLFASGG
ncbi:MAG: threonine ammonia-lyase, biosynthetic [Gammaproteobacteria bacterium]|nr:MAG: threonine ammonia-lyase, biosynthetic [Gammaproteobacteria bacterium]